MNSATEAISQPLSQGTVNGAASAAIDFAGVILGTSVCDALGLPREGLSRQWASSFFRVPQARLGFRSKSGESVPGHQARKGDQPCKIKSEGAGGGRAGNILLPAG